MGEQGHPPLHCKMPVSPKICPFRSPNPQRETAWNTVFKRVVKKREKEFLAKVLKSYKREK